MSKVYEVATGLVTTDTILPVNSSITAVTADPLPIVRARQLIIVVGWAQITTGADSTSCRILLQRSLPVPVLNISETNTLAIVAAGGNNQQLFVMAVDESLRVSQATYRLNLLVNGTLNNGVVLQAGIVAIGL